ncbi:carbohydrate binding domain-containing protein [Hymenobacter metallicola]|uniref:CBM-cenC domain-containing protein n=1 Tax=Hymenobacter metallicola TaxID=2563114 RepID=A0A4Z0QAK7_9BACT|nr:carbohydrate binding domain-containing protein [Hymenobacter metallicola]TGE26496.1 hypothetical protein E5K02_17030 [Hymenobacter metallicola]
MKKLLYAVFTLGVVACGDNKSETPANLLAKNDFESLEGWTSGVPAPSLTKEQAHSGRYSIKVGPAVEYSLGYSNQLGKLSANRVKKIKIHGWAYLPDKQSNGVVVTEIKDPATGKNLIWEGLEIGKQTKTVNKWVEIEKVIEIPATAAYTSFLNVYMWRANSSQNIYLDDLEITSEG